MRTKGMVLGLAMFCSGAVFGTEISEFERGYLAGKDACLGQLPPAPTSGVICTLPTTYNFSPKSYNGRTKAEALLKADATHLGQVYTENKSPNCVSF